ncbi:MAG: hypothetical protein F6J86_41485 [Symploca sp. SIO1B1]|nr:hypothetical protein [Symploca sp. SIO1B1]
MSHELYKQEQLAELKEEYDAWREQIQELNKSLRVDDLAPRQRMLVKRQIKEAEAEFQEIRQQIELLAKNTVSSEQLYKLLLKLGYKRQVRLFRQLVKAQSVSAFLIHGSPEHGQRWLLNRLVGQYVPHSISGKVVKIDLGRKVRRTNVSALWRQLGSYFNLCSRGISPSEIAERVYRCWQTQNVLFVFHDVDCMPPAYLQELIQNFWQPLTKKARNYGTSDFQLLMFLVDYEGTVGNLDALFSEKINPTKLYPVKPPKINQFTEESLLDWMETEFEQLPIELTHDLDDTVRAILEESEGIPEYVLTEIFDRCGFNYYEEVDRQWKL